MSGIEIAICVVSGVSYIIHLVTGYKMRQTVKKTKQSSLKTEEISKKANENLERLVEYFGIECVEETNDATVSPVNNSELREIDLNTPRDSIMSLPPGAKYNKTKGELILPKKSPHTPY